MPAKRLTAKDMTGLEPRHQLFVIEYVKDFDHRRAAEAVGWHPDKGIQLLKLEQVEAAIAQIVSKRCEAYDIDAEWVMMELVDNHQIARQRGKISASNTALATIAKLAAVDAFAAEKIMTTTDQAVLDRLQRGRQRVGLSPPSEETEEVSFL